MTEKTRFLLLRASIYLTGFLIIAWVIGLNLWELKEETASLQKAENGNYFVYTKYNYDFAELTLEFEDEIPENLQVEISKDFSVFLTHRKKGIYTKEKLEEKLFKNNPTQYPNGSFVKFKNKIYFLDEGDSRLLSSSSILEIFNFKKENLQKIIPEEFEKFARGEPLTYASINEDFPQNIIIKKDSLFYITGSSGYYPLHIPNVFQLIRESNYHYIELSTDLIKGRCYKGQNSQAICKFDLKKTTSNFGNIYLIKFAENRYFSNINNSTIKLIGNPTLNEIWQEIIKLFTK